MKSPFFRLLLLVFITAFLYDDPQLFLWKRLLYSAFLYLSIWQMISLYLTFANREIELPAAFRVYSFFYITFIVLNLIASLFSPNFNIITLIINPYALLSTFPIFAFGIGYLSPKNDIVKALAVACITFLFAFFIPQYSNPMYYAGYVCTGAIIPAFIFALHTKKYTLFYFLLLPLACVYSHISDYRIITLKVLIFLGLFAGLNLFKKNAFVKFTILSITTFVIIQVVTNFEEFLNFFQKLFNLSNVYASDTRTFLYEELFDDLKGIELVVGRGFLGSYFSKYFLELSMLHHTYADSFDRFSVEVGFLELILKGGFIYVAFYFLPLLYTAIKTLLTRQYDALTFNLGIYIFVEMLAMFIENIPFFNFEFFMLFFICGFLYRRIHNPVVNTRPMVLATT